MGRCKPDKDQQSKMRNLSYIIGLGILDLNAKIKLGDLLLFIENIKIKKMTQKVTEIDIFILKDNKTISKGNNDFSTYISIIHNYLSPRIVGIFEEESKLKEYISINLNSYRFCYPHFKDYSHGNHPFDNTALAREHNSKGKNLPYLSARKESLRWAEHFIHEHCKDSIVITVHLKNRLGQQSNAQMEQWFQFFKYCQKNQPIVKFVIIGNDILPKKIKYLSNIIVSKDYGNTIVQDLLLIESSKAYFGMCSGPFQIALFNQKPYLVFKNPSHHVQEMIEEIGFGNRYPFSQPNQNILREFETAQKITNGFNHLLAIIKKNEI